MSSTPSILIPLHGFCPFRHLLAVFTFLFQTKCCTNLMVFNLKPWFGCKQKDFFWVTIVKLPRFGKSFYMVYDAVLCEYGKKHFMYKTLAYTNGFICFQCVMRYVSLTALKQCLTRIIINSDSIQSFVFQSY